MNLPQDVARCHGIKLAADAPVLADCWACRRNTALGDMGPLTTVWPPTVALVTGDDGIARIDCGRRLPVLA